MRSTAELVDEGVDKFAEAADKLYAALATKRLKLLDGSIAKVSETLGPAEDAVKAAIAEWTHWGSVRRLWARDKALWTNGDEDQWLGWLDIAARERADLSQLTAFARGDRRLAVSPMSCCWAWADRAWARPC